MDETLYRHFEFGGNTQQMQVTEKQIQRDEINADVAKFLAAGGEIKVEPIRASDDSIFYADKAHMCCGSYATWRHSYQCARCNSKNSVVRKKNKITMNEAARIFGYNRTTFSMKLNAGYFSGIQCDRKGKSTWFDPDNVRELAKKYGKNRKENKITLKEAASIFGYNRTTFSMKVNAGHFPGIECERKGKSIWFDPDNVREIAKKYGKKQVA